MTGTIQAASLGIPDTIFIMLLALVVFGPRKLPEIGRQIGKLMYEFRKASNEFKYQMEEEMRKSEEADRRKKLDEENRALYPTLGAPAATDTSIITAANPTENSIAKPEDMAESTVLTIQPPSTGETVLRGKSMSQLTAEAEALAEQTRTAIAERTANASDKTKTPAKPRAPRKPALAKTVAEPKSTTESEITAAVKPKKVPAKKKAVAND